MNEMTFYLFGVAIGMVCGAKMMVDLYRDDTWQKKRKQDKGQSGDGT